MAEDMLESAAFDPFADYYDLADIDRSPELGFYSSLLGSDTRSLLELGCGTGTIAIALARHLAGLREVPARIAGVDESARMVNVARRRAPELEWIQGDMRAPAIRGSFDAVLCCFQTLQLMLTDDDLLRVFCAARELMEADGIFAFDIYQPNLDFLNGPFPEQTVRTCNGEDGRSLEVREKGEYDPQSRVLITEWHLVARDDDTSPPLASMRIPMRQYFPDEIEQLLTAAGLAIRERYGFYDRSEFTPQSKKQVLVCTRR